MILKLNLPNDRSGQLGIGGLTLKSGVNTVAKSDWLKLRNRPSVQKRLENGVIEEHPPISDEEWNDYLGGEKLKEGEPEVVTTETAKTRPPEVTEGVVTEEEAGYLQKVTNMTEAKELIKMTTSIELLQEWRKREKRNVLKGDIDKQIAIMEKPLETLETRNSSVETGKGTKHTDLGTFE